jgi:esterase
MSEIEDDEAALLAEAARELGVEPAPVARRFVTVGEAQRVSLLTWGSAEPELVLLHGGGQNAHTWDSLLLLLGRPAVAIDLPGHGHSDWRDDRDYGPVRSAASVATVIEAVAPRASAVIGMSLGGLTLLHLAAARPDLVRRAVLIDVSPGSREAGAAMSASQRGAVQLTGGPRVFASRDAMVDAAVAASPRRAPSAVRRGVLHNSRQLPDGTWAWRYDRPDPGLGLSFAVDELWADAGRLSMPVMLATGEESGFVTPADLAELRRLLPALRHEPVAGAGHAVQSDQPAVLAGLIRDFVPELA